MPTLPTRLRIRHLSDVTAVVVWLWLLCWCDCLYLYVFMCCKYVPICVSICVFFYMCLCMLYICMCVCMGNDKKQLSLTYRLACAMPSGENIVTQGAQTTHVQTMPPCCLPLRACVDFTLLTNLPTTDWPPPTSDTPDLITWITGQQTVFLID